MTNNPTVLPAEKVLRMATLEGAESLKWQREIGSIEEGKKADLAIINFKKPHLRPVYNEISHLVYSTKSSDVETVIINGEVVMENGIVKTVNVDEVLEKVEETKLDLLTRVQND
jgi:5-methylthioadenosine/S-adenosylhomocysteine deaminase